MSVTTAAACPLCSGTLESRTIRYAVADGSRVIVFEDVPARACRQCGEPTFAGTTVDQMNRFAWSLPDVPGDEPSVHFYSIAKALMAAPA